MVHTLLLDLDNTLYPKSSGLMDAIRGRIISYMRDILNLSEEEISSVREYSLKKYGTSLIGLIERYGIDEREYMEYVHDFDLNLYLRKDNNFRFFFKSLPQRKIIFSNANIGHIQNVLKYLDIFDAVDLIIDASILQPYVKPKPDSFKKAFIASGLSSWEGCMFIDDHLPNVLAAEKLGLHSFLVDERNEVDYSHKISCLQNLKEILS